MLRANDVASVILARSGPWMDAMTLQKLLYYAQAWHLAVTDEPLFDENIKAWKDGPVIPQVWHERKDRSTRRAATQSVDHVQLDDLDSDLLDLVLAAYGSMSAQELRALTHVEDPWNEARGNLGEDAECRTAISMESMALFYRTNRRLGGRTAADLAAGGIHRHSREAVGPIDVDALLSQVCVEDDSDEDTWGGANLWQQNSADLTATDPPRRAYADA